MATEEEMQMRERLTSLEAKLGFISKLLQEIRDELKDQPSKDDYRNLNSRLSALEKSQTSMAIKIGIGSGILGVLGGLLIKFIMG